MALKLFEFLEQFKIDTFLRKLTQFGKTGLIGKFFVSLRLRNPRMKFHFRNWKSTTFFVTFNLSLFDSGVYLPFNKGNELNLKTNQKSNREK